ncbi:hypothetical protein PAMP_011617 [Pampus punctatissimus]
MFLLYRYTLRVIFPSAVLCCSDQTCRVQTFTRTDSSELRRAADCARLPDRKVSTKLYTPVSGSSCPDSREGFRCGGSTVWSSSCAHMCSMLAEMLRLLLGVADKLQGVRWV